MAVFVKYSHFVIMLHQKTLQNIFGWKLNYDDIIQHMKG